MQRVITLLSDFGLEDHYVSSMKAIIIGISPETRIVDISHLIHPQDVRSGAYVLANASRLFPNGTVHVAVVDPGVGTERRALAIRTSQRLFVGPDNGIFSLALREESEWDAWCLQNPSYWRSPVSRTFHGRDIFAPVAAHLARGISPDLMGPSCTPMSMSWASPTESRMKLSGEVIHIDHFGNAISNITMKDLDRFCPDGRYTVRIAGKFMAEAAETYGQKKSGTVMALTGSGNHLEIAVSQGSAAEELGILQGTPVEVMRRV